MSTLELKTEFHKLIDRIEDEEQLRTFYEWIVEQVDSEPVPLMPEELARMQRQIQDFKEGKGTYHTNEEVQAEIRQWLRNKSK